MESIAITLPELMPGDARLIIRALDKGYSRVHIRKPDATDEQIAKIIEQIPVSFRERISIHNHIHLAERYGLGGVHLSSNTHAVPQDFNGIISRSCHSFEEILHYKDSCNYLFLSPIYDSISKTGYKSNFGRDALANAFHEGIVDSKVYALGGVTPSKFPELEELGFGGGAMLGCVWKELMTPPIVLTIAGSDSSAGAGIQADLKTIAAYGCYGASVITAITAQNTLGVQAVEPVSSGMVLKQMSSVLDDLDVSVIKIGMIHDMETAKTIVDVLSEYPDIPIVYDPVMVSTSGTILMKEDCRAFIEDKLFPMCTLITPNLHESALLMSSCRSSGDTILPSLEEIADLESGGSCAIKRMEHIAEMLSTRYGCAVLVKGGHLEGDSMCDILYDGSAYMFEGSRVISSNLHGTGCTLSSAIACELALGMGFGIVPGISGTSGKVNSLATAVRNAKSYIHQAITCGADMRIGHGNGPLWHQCR